MKAKIWNNSGFIDNTDEIHLKQHFKNILDQSGFTQLGFIEHEFEPFGYTGLWLLGESHFAIHTFPEEKKTYFELSSCVKLNFIKFLELM